MRLLKSLLITLPLMGLAACATAPDTSAPTIADAHDTGSLYGLFLAGRKALNEGHGQEAADYFARAADSQPDAAFLKEQAFTAALFAGDVHRAAGLAPGADEASASAQRLGRLTRAVDALAMGDGRAAQAALAGDPLGPPHRAAGLLLQPWAAAAAGDWKDALTLPDARGDPLVSEVAQLDQALLFERGRHYDEADALFRKLLASGDGGGATIIYGEFLERRGRRADAKELYDASLKGDASNHMIQTARDRVATGRPAPAAPTMAQGAAQALLVIADTYLSERQPELALAYLQLVLRLDPGRGEAAVLLGDTLMEAGDVNGARAAFRRIKPGSDQYVTAASQLILTYQQPQDAADALTIAQETVKNAPGDDDALALLADCLRVSERYDESAKVLDTLIAHLGDRAGWQLYYMRGVALAEAKHWEQAEPDLKKALLLRPDEPEALNYLGYSWVDRGEHLQEAKAMIEKAAAAKPDSGAIIDSLGWAYFKLGDYKQAVEQLERAASLEAADPDINNHLGDAYWAAGRRIEAQYQWQRVLTLDPSASLRMEVETKLKSGLATPPPAGSSPRIASR